MVSIYNTLVCPSVRRKVLLREEDYMRWRIKTFDKLIIRSFIPPFVVTFFIAHFVLVMQFLWKYIDDIVGKGATFFMILELIGYLSISLIIMALPIAVLISSVMVMGNLAERYELASMKSAGVRLLRIMQPLIFLTLGISIFSFYCSNVLIPYSNLKYKLRLKSLSRQKPSLLLEEGVFNEDFANYSIYIGGKDPDNRSIRDILLYDHSRRDQDPVLIAAKEGEMYMTKDGQYFVMQLKGGTQYQASKATQSDKGESYPYTRTTFASWNKVFDLAEFDIKGTNEEFYKSHYAMLNVRQLAASADSIDQRILKREEEYKGLLARSTHLARDTLTDDAMRSSASQLEQKKAQQSFNKKQEEMPKSLESLLILSDSIPRRTASSIVSSAKSIVRTLKNQAHNLGGISEREGESKVKHLYELHNKFSMALSCLIFLFIGAPMGAIVRKGGFGYPILIAVIFFMIYIVLSMMFKKLAESFVLSGPLAAWMPCIILFPIGLVLTMRAMNDKKILENDRWQRFIKRFKKSPKEKHASTPATV